MMKWWLSDFAVDIVSIHLMKRKGKKREKNTSEATNPIGHLFTERQRRSTAGRDSDVGPLKPAVLNRQGSGCAGASIFKQPIF